MAIADLTAARVRELLDYNPATGVFARRREAGGRRPKHGAIGCLFDGYLRIWIDGRQEKAHRLAWLHFYGEAPSGAIDHINGVRNDNRIENLRVVSTRMNAENIRAARDRNQLGVLGVSRTRGGKFSATIRAELAGHDLQLYLGSYKTEAEANAVYLAAKRRLHDGCTI